jgi:3-methyladenine DNA glycosylase Mpg
VLIRAADPLDDWKANLSDPGRLTRALQIIRLQDGLDLTGPLLYSVDNPGYQPVVQSAKRIGFDYALQWKDSPLRFVDTNRWTGQPR